MLSGVDGNSAQARRYRDLVEGLTAEIGEDLGEMAGLQVRNAAALQLHVEDLTARLARGEVIGSDDLTRAANAASRAISGLRRRKAERKPASPSVAEYLASKRGEVAA